MSLLPIKLAIRHLRLDLSPSNQHGSCVSVSADASKGLYRMAPILNRLVLGEDRDYYGVPFRVLPIFGNQDTMII